MRPLIPHVVLAVALLGCHKGAGPIDPEPPPSFDPGAEAEEVAAGPEIPAPRPEPRAPEPDAADPCTLEGLAGALEGSAPWTTEGARCFEVFADACEAGNAEACGWAAVTSLERIGGAPHDAKRVHALLNHGCELGSADGCRNVGALHLRGDLGDRGKAAEAAARPWFEKACALGHSQACGEAEALAPRLVQVEGANLSAGSMSVDGFEVRDLACALEGRGALFGTMAIAASLAERKKAVDRCAPAGQAFVVHWRFAGTKTTEVDVRGGTEPQRKCVAKAIGAAKAVMPARCGAIVFAGDAKVAEASIAALGG